MSPNERERERELLSLAAEKEPPDWLPVTLQDRFSLVQELDIVIHEFEIVFTRLTNFLRERNILGSITTSNFDSYPSHLLTTYSTLDRGSKRTKCDTKSPHVAE
ncbi:hypothetical protein TNCV_1525961 [Trichonephila clavipes]|nr:hypothetical protein TNCV_1525961 [Trichonephila clavipes]